MNSMTTDSDETPFDAGEGWDPIARRGEFEMIVITEARCALDGILMHPDATFVGLLHPDGKPPFTLGFISVERLREYISETAPRMVVFRGVSEDDALAFRALVEDARPGSAVLH